MKNMTESGYRDAIVRFGASLHARGYVPGSSGNISVRLPDAILLTPTNSCLGDLDPGRLSKIDLEGRHLDGDKPSKEGFLHALMYGRRKDAAAVVHLHCTHAVAVSCLPVVPGKSPIRALTPYFVMKIGALAVVPYYPPGDKALAHAVESAAERHTAILLANHGPVVAGPSLDAAVYAIEELEEAAKLHLLLGNRPVKELTKDQIETLDQLFPR